MMEFKYIYKIFYLCPALVFIFTVTSLLSPAKGENEFEGAGVLDIDHSFTIGGDATEFEPRGTIAIKSVRNGLGSYQTKPDAVNAKFIQQLKLAASSGGSYRVRVPTSLSSSSSSQQPAYVYGWARACELLSSGLTDEVHIHVGGAGDVVSLSTFTSSTGCGHWHDDDDMPEQFNTTVHITNTVQGPQPDTQAYLEKVEKERIEREKGETGDNRSFLAKYWMYIVPVVIFLLISNMANPEGQGGGR